MGHSFCPRGVVMQINQIIIDICQIIIMAIPLYLLLRFLRTRKGYRILISLLLILFIVGFLAYIFQMDEICWMLEHFAWMLPLCLVIIFQPDLRVGLAEISDRKNGTLLDIEESVKDQLVEGIETLVSRRIGALIAIERGKKLDDEDDLIDMIGHELDCGVTADLLVSIFFPKSPLHDGGVVIRNGKICAAGCVFPLSSIPGRKPYGTRHRAGLGLTEKSDALVIIVSEEMGILSIAYRGELYRGFPVDRLRDVLDVASREASLVDEALNNVETYKKDDNVREFDMVKGGNIDKLEETIIRIDKEGE